MDAYDAKYKQAASLLPIIKAKGSSSQTATKFTEKSEQDFIHLVNELLEVLELAKWPCEDVEKRWRLLEPLLAELDGIYRPTPTADQIPPILQTTFSPQPQTKEESKSESASPPFLSENKSPSALLQSQYEAMEKQDEALLSLSDNIRNLTSIGKTISEESKSQSKLLDSVSSHVDSLNAKTDSSLAKVKKL